MPAEIIVMADCQSNYGVYKLPGSKGTVYTVSFGGSEGPAHCTCPAYKFSGEGRHCKHIEKVWNGACMYNPQWCKGHNPIRFKPVEYTYDAVVPDEECPNCGGPVVAVRRAV